MSASGQCYGTVGFQGVNTSDGIGQLLKGRDLRSMYAAGMLALSPAVLAVAKPSDHASAVALGKVSVADLIAHGVDIHACQVAHNRKLGDGSKARAQRAAMVAAPSTVEATVIAQAANDAERKALAKLALARKAKRSADKAAQGGKVYSGAELAALAASYGVAVAVRG